MKYNKNLKMKSIAKIIFKNYKKVLKNIKIMFSLSVYKKKKRKERKLFKQRQKQKKIQTNK